MYWPPTNGNRDPSSAQMNPPTRARPPPMDQARTINAGVGRRRATFDGLAKMPTPMIAPATTTIASNNPSSRRKPVSDMPGVYRSDRDRKRPRQAERVGAWSVGPAQARRSSAPLAATPGRGLQPFSGGTHRPSLTNASGSPERAWRRSIAGGCSGYDGGHSSRHREPP